jgi:hypothetical protein
MNTRNIAPALIIGTCIGFGLASSYASTAPRFENNSANAGTMAVGQSKIVSALRSVVNQFAMPLPAVAYRDAMNIPAVEGGSAIINLPETPETASTVATVNVPEITIVGYVPVKARVSAPVAGNWKLYPSEISELGHSNNSFSGQ